MEVGLVYSSSDPRQLKARDFVINYIKERGILARIVESDEPVESPQVIVNGQRLTDLRKKPRKKGAAMFPDLEAIARILEQHAWCL